jgi:hypothetical protein
MDASGVAALTGAAIGGLTSAAAAWFTQRAIAKSQWLANETARRQDIYRDFIEVSAKCYIDALQHENPDILGLVLYEFSKACRIEYERHRARQF